MAVTVLPADPHGRVMTLLRARQVSCRGGLTDLADAVLTITQPPPPWPVSVAVSPETQAAWRRERSAVLLDRDVLVCALADLAAAADRHLHAGNAATVAELAEAVADARDALVPLPPDAPRAG